MYKTPEIETGPGVSYLGPKGTYSEEAVLKRFGENVELNPTRSVEEALSLAENGTTDYAMVPLKNSTINSLVRDTELLLSETGLNIVAEEILLIKHAILVPKGVFVGDVKQVYGHEQAIAQCKHNLAFNLPNAEVTLASSNTASIYKVLQSKDSAMIASAKVANITSLKVALSDMQDDENNHTRFAVFAKHETEPTDNDKTSILCKPVNLPGGLEAMINPLGSRGISMTLICSSKDDLGGHAMYVEIDGHAKESHVAEAIGEMRDRATDVRVLGSYPVSLAFSV